MEWALQLGDEKVKKQYRDPMSQSLVSINILSRIMPVCSDGSNSVVASAAFVVLSDVDDVDQNVSTATVADQNWLAS